MKALQTRLPSLLIEGPVNVMLTTAGCTSDRRNFKGSPTKPDLLMCHMLQLTVIDMSCCPHSLSCAGSSQDGAPQIAEPVKTESSVRGSCNRSS